jgi:hypothetical protein
MGSYLALHMSFQSSSPQAGMIEPLFSNDLFQPVAIGAIAGRESGDNWFLAGYALEEFVSIFSTRATPPATIEIAASHGDEEYDYLSALADHLRSLNMTPWTLSPFETVDATTGVTYLGQRRLTVSVLTTLADWLTRYPKGAVYLFGSLKIAAQKSHELPWRHAFRFLYPKERQTITIGAPFLDINVRKYVSEANITGISVRSESGIWLRERNALNGYVGRD